MSRRVLVEEYQEITGQDLTNIGVFGEEALDTVVYDGIVEGNRYAGCQVVQEGVAGISVAPGRAYLGGRVYPRAEATGFALTAQLPLALTRMATVIVAGQETDVDLQPRDYIINETTGETEARTAPRERRRSMTVSVIYGVEAANPVRAVIPPGAVAVADILLPPPASRPSRCSRPTSCVRPNPILKASRPSKVFETRPDAALIRWQPILLT
jgi:hypothetical protein